MRKLIAIACATGFVLAAASIGLWMTSVPAISSHPSAIDPHGITVQTKDLPAQQIENLY